MRIQRVKKKERKKIRRPSQQNTRRRTRAHGGKGVRRRISSNIHDACTSDVRHIHVVVVAIAAYTQRAHIPIHSERSSKFLCLFFSSCIAPFPVSMHRSRRRERRSAFSLSFSFLFLSHVRRELCFRNVRATHTNACTRPWASARAHTHTHTCTYDSRCVCVVQTDVRSRAARLVGKREESKVEGSAPRYSSTFGSACQKALFTVSRENELFNSSRCRW